MSPMSVNTFDACTLKSMVGRRHGAAPHGERSERRMAHLAICVIGLAMLVMLLCATSRKVPTADRLRTVNHEAPIASGATARMWGAEDANAGRSEPGERH